MRVNLGIIGTGSAIRRLHLPVLRKMPEAFRIVGLTNRTRAKAENLAREIGGAKVYDQYKALLDDPEIDAVLISVPVELNAPVLIDAILAGKHVLAEKPIAASPEEALKVLCACIHRDKVIGIAENFRYREDVAKARDLIVGGELGDVYGFKMSTQYDMEAEFRRTWFAEGTWRHSPTYPGGMITDTSIHMISSLRDILGEVREVYAQELNASLTTKSPDFFAAQFTMTNGAIGQYLACFSAKVAKENVFDFMAFGQRGSLQLTEAEVTWSRSGSKEVFAYRVENYDRGYTNQWKNFHRAICGDEALLSTPEEAYRDLLVIDAALRSAASGVKVQLDQPPDCFSPAEDCRRAL